MMKLAAVATALLLTGAMITEASAYSRSSTTVGPRGGVWSSQGSGSCSGGSCASSQSVTGPRGHSATRQGSTTCSGGSCQGSATYTGPRGNTATRSRSLSR